VRENGEQIALLNGETAEQVRLMDRFGKVIVNWFALMSRQKKLSFFTTGFQQIAVVFPYLVASPAYFAGLFQLGGLMQTASAFHSVQSSLSFFASSSTYREFAEWRAVIARLEGFSEAIEVARSPDITTPFVSVDGGRARDIQIKELELWLPTGDPVVTAGDIAFCPGDRVLVTGPSGAGKSTLFRAIAGIWPFGTGTLAAPANAKMMMLPQRPYLPLGSLAAALTYPAAPGTFKHAQLVAALRDVGLARFVERLDEVAHWGQQMSLGEQQRVGIARAILLSPDYLFLDEATASLDEASEAAMYRVIEAKLPRAVVVSIGHRSTLKIFHNRILKLLPEGDYHRVYECASRATGRADAIMRWPDKARWIGG
jgi:putative ATP-binding cassette transporter